MTTGKLITNENILAMPAKRSSFYEQAINKWVKDKNASILVVGGGETDQNVFLKLGFKNVVISNLDIRLTGNEFSPYSWSFQKAENLSYKDNEFDFVVIHAALHHCESPHRSLLEMYRVSKIGLIAFEGRDSLLMRLLEAANFSPIYEHCAVYYNDCKFGGVNNTEIPNYVYKWTEREIEKTINTYAPYAKHQFHYEYGHDVPFSASIEKKANFKKLLISIATPFYKVFILLFPKQQNLFGFYVQKPNLSSDLHPWLELQGKELKFNADWARAIYK